MLPLRDMNKLKSINEKYTDKLSRIHNFDLLRGFVIFLALYQHYVFYLNIWYVTYFRDVDVLNQAYDVHKSMMGQPLKMDTMAYVFGLVFIPWVSQIYLTLAAFNLSRKKDAEFNKSYPMKIKIFIFIFIFFILENFLVAPNFGEAISFYPIMAWMVILSVIATLYRYLGVRGVWGLFLLSLLIWLMPETTNTSDFVSFMQKHVHHLYEFDAEITYFLSSGCIGFLMGHYYHHRDWGAKREVTLIGAGLFLVVLWSIFGEENTGNYLNIFASEHFLAETFFGSMFILGIQLILIPLFLLIEKYFNYSIHMPILNYVGVESLSIFALHRVLFVFIFAPVMLFIGTIFNQPLINSTLIIWPLCGLVFCINYFMKKTKIHEIILG
jgi:hypothetical protein